VHRASSHAAVRPLAMPRAVAYTRSTTEGSMEPKAFAGIEVYGQGIEFAVEGFSLLPSVGVRYLTRFGFGVTGVDGKIKFDTNAWYPLDRWIELFQSITHDVGGNVMFTIGRDAGTKVGLPIDVKDIHGVFGGIDVAYHLFHRRDGRIMFDPLRGRMLDGIGHYHYRPVAGQNRIVEICEGVPYPCDFDRGLYTGFAHRFQPRAQIIHDDSAPCRKRGGDGCSYVVTW
jgi:hypothetical protein